MNFKLMLFALVVLFGIIFVLSGSKAGNNEDKYKSSSNALTDMVGKPASDFTLQSYDGKTFTLNQQRGKKVILFFNEGIMCYPACWNQIAALGTDSKLNNEQTVTASIVADSRDEWTEAIQRMPDLGKGTILLDSDKVVSTRYNMLNQPSSMHKGMLPGHTYVIIDKNAIIRYVYDDPKMGNQNSMLADKLSQI